MAKEKNWQEEGRRSVEQRQREHEEQAARDEEGRRFRERFDRAAQIEAERIPKRLQSLEEEKRRILAGAREKTRRGVHGDTFESERGLTQQDRSRLAEIDLLLNAPAEVKFLKEGVGKLEHEQAGLRREIETEKAAVAKAEKKVAEKKPEAKKARVSPFKARQLTAQLESAKRRLELMEGRRSLAERLLGLFGKKPVLEAGVRKEIEELEAELKVTEAETLAAKSEETDRLIRRGSEERLEDLRSRLMGVNDRLERARKDLEYQESILKRL